MSKTKKARLIVASSWDCADMLYLTGFKAGDPFIYYSVDGSEGIVLTALEHSRGLAEAKPTIEVIDRNTLVPKNGKTDMLSILKLLTRLRDVSEWEVPHSFPLGLAESLRDEGVQLSCSKGPFAPRRQVKTALEVKKIRKAMWLAELAMSEFESALKESEPVRKGELMWRCEPFTSEAARGLIDATVARNGGFPSGTIVACGLDASAPHNTGRGALKANAPIVVDIFPRMDTGYWGDITRTFVKGKAPDVVRKAYDAVRQARDRAKALIKPGAISGKVFDAAKKVLDGKGFKTGTRHGVHFGFFHGLGHGVGLEIHEAPRIGAGGKEPLNAGEVVTVEPGVYYPAWGGIRLEDVVVVRQDSAECLTTYHDILEVE